MKKFIVKSFLFLAIVALIAVFINLLNKNVKSNYMAAIIDKHKRLDSIKSPKIILAGGSNLAFGINSGKIREGI